MHRDVDRANHSPPRMILAGVLASVVDESGWGFIADAVAHLCLPPRSQKSTPFVPSASPGIVVLVLGVNLDAKAGWDFLNIPPSGVIDIRSSL